MLLCNKHIDTIYHPYWEYPNNQRLIWERFKLLILETLDWSVPMDPVEMLLGISNVQHKVALPHLLYLLYLITKNYIHSCKCMEKVPNGECLISHVIIVSAPCSWQRSQLSLATAVHSPLTTNGKWQMSGPWPSIGCPSNRHLCNQWSCVLNSFDWLYVFSYPIWHQAGHSMEIYKCYGT